MKACFTSLSCFSVIALFLLEFSHTAKLAKWVSDLDHTYSSYAILLGSSGCELPQRWSLLPEFSLIGICEPLLNTVIYHKEFPTAKLDTQDVGCRRIAKMNVFAITLNTWIRTTKTWNAIIHHTHTHNKEHSMSARSGIWQVEKY